MRIKKIQTWQKQIFSGCTGYYNHDRGYQPDFPEESFKGEFVNPQFWPPSI